MKIDILFPVLPPVIDGIGDHTARLAAALSRHAQVRILSAQASYDPIDGVDVVQAFSMDKRSGVFRVVDVIARDPPDWLFIQFNQFSYGKWGLNPFLPLAIAAVRRRCPKTRIAWMAHEDFVPVTSWKFAVMTTWQRAQFVALGRMADHIFFSIQPWVDKYRDWFSQQPISYLPVGSNIPLLGRSRDGARAELGIEDEALIVGVFGTINKSRLLGHIARAVNALWQDNTHMRVLYVGPAGFSLARALPPQVSVYDAGVLPPEEVSTHLMAMDIHLAPYSDGISTRRGAFLAGLQHGVPSVTTVGVHTDSLLRKEVGHAFCAPNVSDIDGFVATVCEIACDVEKRKALGNAGRQLYEKHFTFERTAAKLMEALSTIGPRS